MTVVDLIPSICGQNLAVYRASPIRLREDVGQEAEIAHDYRGRIVYELLQNADDAMADSPGTRDTVFVRLTDTDLWVGNSGRPLDEDDVRGLCGIGASSKGAAIDRKRASIGHKGMGFKSVLEITDAPEVISETFAFRLGRHLATEQVGALMREIGQPAPARMPSMRFPATLDALPPEWDEAYAGGLRTLFRFPLRGDLSPAQRNKLADRLIDLPVTAILFLKHLERIAVEVDTVERSETFRWMIRRAVEDDGEWSPVSGLSRTGLFRVEVEADHSEQRTFLVAHDDDLEIGVHRGGLDEYAWDGVELSEVSVAVQLVDDMPVPVDLNARVLHVFLPTGEPCPYPIVINGAFSADLSRQEVRASADPDDYNAWLLCEAARVFASHLVPALLGFGAADVDVLGLLQREATEPGDEAPTSTLLGSVTRFGVVGGGRVGRCRRAADRCGSDRSST